MHSESMRDPNASGEGMPPAAVMRSRCMRDDHLVLLEPDLDLPGEVGEKVRRKEDLLGN